MSLNGFNGPPGRPAARPSADQTQGAQSRPTWHSPQGHEHQFQSPPQWPQPAPGEAQGYAQPGQSPLQQGFPQQPGTSPLYGGQGLGGDAYAPNFQPYNPAAQLRGGHGAQPQPQGLPPQPPPQPAAYQPGFGGHAGEPQWGQPHAAQLQAGYRAAEMRHPEAEPHFNDWQQGYAGQQPQGYDYGDPQGHGEQALHHDHYGDMGFAQAQGGELEQAYAEDDEEEYDEYEEESSGRRPLVIVAALAGAIFVGGSLAYGYKALFGGGPGGTPPVVKSANAPTKTKPADAGGKQFAHADSKIMGRLGDGSGSSAANDLDANGTRKVSTLVVGRDGSIQAPPAAPAPSATVSVPGLMVVDALGTNTEASAEPASSNQGGPQKVVVTPPPAPESKPVTVAKAQVLNSAAKTAPETGSVADDPAPVKQAAPRKVAALATEEAAPVAPVTSGSGYVAVLASVPKSSSSRMDALKRFADLQQKYSGVLAGKTPDVAEANLGAKGAYHRLVVGPPGSRQQASAVCVQLKANGYSDCWVTTY